MRENDQPAIWFLREGYDDAIDLGGIVHVACHGLDCQPGTRFLNRLPHALLRESFRVHDRKDTGDIWRSLLKHLNPFATHRRRVTGETGDIATRPRKTRNKPAADWVANTDEHDRHTSRDWLKYLQGKVGECYCDIGRTRDEFSGPNPHLRRIIIPPLHLHKQVTTLPPPQVVQP